MELDEAETFSNYTIVFDVRISDYSWRGLLQTNLKNNEDAGFFINTKGQVGLGVGGFGYAGMIELNKWARIAIVVKDGYPSVYIDGTLVKTSTSTNNNRWFMDKSGAYLFCDNDGETADTDIAGIYFWNKALTAEQIGYYGCIRIAQWYKMKYVGLKIIRLLIRRILLIIRVIRSFASFAELWFLAKKENQFL